LQTKECRRTILGSYLDGTGYDCHIYGNASLCDNCDSDIAEENENTMVASAEAMEDFYIMPAVGSIIVADSGNEQQRQKNVRDFALRFQSAMNEVVGTCTVCKASGSSDDKHRFSSSCSCVRRRCLGCLSNEHFITKQCPCPNKLKFAPNVGICFRCGISNRIQQVILHPNRILIYAFAVLYLTKYNR
jgi:hypothetical protein